jgi:hypothetical protein
MNRHPLSNLEVARQVLPMEEISLPKLPAVLSIDVDDEGRIRGLL